MRTAFAKCFVGASVALIGFIGVAQANECSDKKEITNLFNKWNDSLQTGNPETVTELYSEDAVLLPTVSNKVRADHAAIADYFQHFLELKPKGTLNEVHLACYGEIAINEGLYTFDTIQDGKPVKVYARYTFVYHKDDGEWKIVSHHSSAMPEPVN
jgi:uncharacterized protein (TIGR02246 family)